MHNPQFMMLPNMKIDQKSRNELFSLKFLYQNFSLTFLLLFLFISCIGNSQSVSKNDLVKAAVELTNQEVVYDPSYFSIPYPNGDIPSGKGVCTDVVIRAFRGIGIDLQQEVHKDMKSNFDLYPKIWGLTSTDPNIDHRRVPNLMTYFERFGESIEPSNNPNNYHAGDIVCWNLGGAITHIGIVIDQKSADGKRNLIVHNIGSGQVIEDVLFEYTIIGHYRYGIQP